MATYRVTEFRGGESDYEDKGIAGSFKSGSNLDIRKRVDSLSCGQALKDIGVTLQSASPSISPSHSISPSASGSPSPSNSISPSSSASPSPNSASSSISPSSSHSPSASVSPSASRSPSSSVSASPSPSAGLKTVFSDLVHFFVKCSDGKIYGFGNTGKIYKINPSDFYVQQVYDLHKPIIGAAEKPSSGGKIYLLFATATELHRKEIPGNTSWNDVDASGTVQGDSWPKTNLTATDWHTMANVAGDILIANDSMIAMSAYDDSYTNEALDLIPGNIAKTILERNGKAIIGTQRKDDPSRAVNGAVDAEVPLSQVGDNGDIYYSDFTNSIPVKRLSGGGKVNPGGMCNEIAQVNFFEWEQTALSWNDKQSIGNMALMGVYGADSGKGGIYTFGRKDKNHPFALNLEYLLDADEIGAIISDNGLVYASYREGSSFGVQVVDVTTKATAMYEGLDFKAPDKLPIQVTTWKQAELVISALPAGCSIQFWYMLDKDGTYTRAKTADGSDSFTSTGEKRAIFRIAANAEILGHKIILVPSGNVSPEVHKIRIYFY